MITILGFGHRQRQPLSICKINGIDCLAFLSSLIFNTFATSYRRSMRTINVRQRQINKMAVFPYQPGKHIFPVSELAPSPVMVEYGLVTWHLSLKEMTYRQMLPLTTGLELEEYSHDDRQKVEFTGESSFGNAQMGHNLLFYCIFVEYSIFWQWFSILKCCNPNIANLYQSTLYFNCLH